MDQVAFAAEFAEGGIELEEAEAVAGGIHLICDCRIGGAKGIRQCWAVSCFCLAGGIYSIFALKRVARMGGRKPTFLLGRLEGSGYRHCSGSLRLDLEKIREAAERVARSEGL